MSEGYVYVLSNPAMPDLVKIGKTTRAPEQRAKELSDATGVPMPFNVELAVMSPNCDELEAAVHRRFSDKRMSNNREFFRLTCNDAECVIFGLLHKQVQGFVDNYLPDCSIQIPEYCVSDEDVSEIAWRVGEHPAIVAAAMRDLTTDELQPALKRYRMQSGERPRAVKIGVVE